MPIRMTINIRDKVGDRARNDGADVRAVQEQLNGHMNPPRVKLGVDGKCGPKTIAAIKDFQKVVLGMRMPDGRVDPGGKTLRALNDPASENLWARMSVAPPPGASPAPGSSGGGGAGTTVRYPATAGPQEKATLDKLMASAAKEGETSFAGDVLSELTSDQNYKHFKTLLVGGAGAASWIAEFGPLLKTMRNAGFSAKEVAIVFVQFAQKGQAGAPSLSKLAAFAKSKPHAVKNVGKLGSALFFAAAFITAIEVADHWKNGAYGAAAAEIYGLAMGMAVPWAGALDAVQTILYEYVPSLKGNSTAAAFFRILNAINPIGAGKTAVDAAFSTAHALVVSVRQGRLSTSQLEQCVSRMKGSPMKIFVDIGEDLGDAMHELMGNKIYEWFLK